MANTWWLAYNGSDANDGTTRAKAKLTMVGVQALAGLATNDIIKVHAPITNPLPWSLFAVEADLKAGTKGTNLTTNPGQIIVGSDADGNPAKAYLKAATADANGARSWLRVVANTGFVIMRDIIGDATEKTADVNNYFLARLRDTGSPDPGLLKMEACGVLGGNPGAFPLGVRDLFDVDTTAPPAGTDLFWAYGCYMQNARQIMPAVGSNVKTFERVLAYFDAGSGSMPKLYTQTLAASVPSAVTRVINCTYYASVNIAPPNGIFDFGVAVGIDAGTYDNYNNLVFIETTNGSAALIYMGDSTAGTKTTNTLAGTRGHNVLLGGPSVDASSLHANGWNEKVCDPDKDDATGSDLYPGDVVAFSQPEASVFAHPSSSFAWDALGNGAQFIIPKDLRPIAYLTAGLGGVTPGALPAFLPPTSDWVRKLPEEAIVETWSWLTSVVTSYNGSVEQRMALRLQPRRRYDMVVLLEDEAARRDEYRRLHSAQAGILRVPLFPYATPLTQDSLVGTSKLFFDPTRTDVRSFEYVLVFRPSTEESFLIELGALLADGANTALPLAQTVRSTDIVVPSLEGYMDEPSALAMQALTGAVSLGVRVDGARSSFTRPGSTATITTFDGLNVLDRRPLADDDVPEAFSRLPEVFDNNTGIYRQDQHWLHAFVTGNRAYLVQRTLVPGDMDYWRDFLNAANGMREPFLCPTFREDFLLSSIPSSSSATIDVLTADYDTKYFVHDTYKRLRLEAPAGDVLYRKVTSVLVISPTVQRLTLNVALPGTAAWGVGFKVGYLNRVRLGSDVVGLTHLQTATYLGLNVRTTDT